MSQGNEAELNGDAEHAAAIASDTLEKCMSACKLVQPADKCTYWTWNKENSTCIFRGLLKITGDGSSKMDAVTGEKYCTGESKLPLLRIVVLEIL